MTENRGEQRNIDITWKLLNADWMISAASSCWKSLKVVFPFALFSALNSRGWGWSTVASELLTEAVSSTEDVIQSAPLQVLVFVAPLLLKEAKSTVEHLNEAESSAARTELHSSPHKYDLTELLHLFFSTPLLFAWWWPYMYPKTTSRYTQKPAKKNVILLHKY